MPQNWDFGKQHTLCKGIPGTGLLRAAQQLWGALARLFVPIFQMVNGLAKGHAASDRAKLETRSSHSKLNVLSLSFPLGRDIGNRLSLLLNYLALFNSPFMSGREKPRGPMASTSPTFPMILKPLPHF